MKKQKKPLTKIEIEKKKERALLISKILSVIALSLSLIALLFSCSFASKNSHDNNNIIPIKRYNAQEEINESFIYTENKGYKVLKGLNQYDIKDFISYIDNYLGDNRDNSIYFISADTETHSIYEVVEINDNVLGSFELIIKYNDEGNIVYYPFVYDVRDYELDNKDIILKFNDYFAYTRLVSQYFSGLVDLYNYIGDTTSFYYNDFTLALLGSFTLESNFLRLNYNISGTLKYYDSDLNYITFDFDYIDINYDNGIQFYTNENIIKVYSSLVGDNKRSYFLQYYDSDNYNNLVCITNLVLSDLSLNNLPDFLIRTDLKYRQNIYLGDLFYSQRKYFSEGSYENIYSFNFISNNRSFNNLVVNYRGVVQPFVYWSYLIAYVDNNIALDVLDVVGTPRVSGNSYNGVDYGFNVKLETYQTFTIFDYFDSDIQSFQRTERIQLTIKSNSSIAGNGALGTAFDVVVGVFTSFIPLLSYEIFPGVSIGVLILIPFLITLMLFIFNMFKR